MTPPPLRPPPYSDAAPRLLQETQKYLSQLTSLMQEAVDEQAKSMVVSHTIGRHVFIILLLYIILLIFVCWWLKLKFVVLPPRIKTGVGPNTKR